MADYIELDLQIDPDALVEKGVDYMEAAIPGFVARSGNVETILLEANAQIGAEIVEQASLVPPIIFAYLGTNLLGLSLRQGTSARATATFTFAVDTPAITVPTGSLMAVPNPTGESYVFSTDVDLDAIEGGGTANIGVTAVDAGAAANGSFGEAEMIDIIDGIQTVFVSAAQGGNDEESADEYLDRLADAMTILAPRPILPRDFATMARQVPGVSRAQALDLYQAGTDDDPVASSTLPGGTSSPIAAGPGVDGVERCVTVAIMGDQGAQPTRALMQSVYNLLDSAREVNFWVYVISPGTGGVYTQIDVKAEVVGYPGNVPADVQAQAEEQMRSWLDPESWGSTGSGGDLWAQDNTARLYEAVEWLNRAPSVHYAVDQRVWLRVHGSPTWVQGDVALPGKVPLPVVGDLEITATVPSG